MQLPDAPPIAGCRADPSEQVPVVVEGRAASSLGQQRLGHFLDRGVERGPAVVVRKCFDEQLGCLSTDEIVVRREGYESHVRSYASTRAIARGPGTSNMLIDFA